MQQEAATMAEKKIRSEVYVARASFLYQGRVLVMEGHTVAAGHPMLRGRERLFRPFVPTWTVPATKETTETVEDA
jgi:hypothetical protein